MITTIKIGLFLGLFLFFLTLYSYSQVSINTDGSQPDSSSVLDIKSTTKGMLIPRMSSSQRNAISTPATGLLVYDNDSHNFWYYNGFGWIELSRKIQSDWNETNDSLADYIKNKPAISTQLFINVTDYGADKTGITDATTAIQNALNAVPGQGGTVFFPAGKYRTAGGLTINKRTNLLGESGGYSYDISSDVYDSLGSVIICTSGSVNMFTINAKDCGFKNIAFINHGTTTPTSGTGLYLSYAGSFRMQDCAVVGFYDNMEIINGESWSILGTTFQNACLYGLKIDSPGNADLGDNLISGCVFMGKINNLTDHIYWESSGGLKISHCKFNGYLDPTNCIELYGHDGSTSDITITDRKSVV